MKKISLIAIALLFVALFMQSCKSSEHCPAYGEIQTPQQVDKV